MQTIILTIMDIFDIILALNQMPKGSLMSTKTLAIVALNETEFLSPELQDKLGGEMYTMYVYDPEEQTYAAERTPSFYLVPFDYAGKTRLSDEDDSEYREDILGEAIYMHCHRIEAMPDDLKDTVEVEWDDEEPFRDQAYALLSADVSHPPRILNL